MAKLFHSKPEDQLRSVRLAIRLTPGESSLIQSAASARKMPAAEFVRRAALGRRADVDYQTDTVLALSEITRSIRELHSNYVAHGVAPPESQMLQVMVQVEAAILRAAA